MSKKYWKEFTAGIDPTGSLPNNLQLVRHTIGNDVTTVVSPNNPPKKAKGPSLLQRWTRKRNYRKRMLWDVRQTVERYLHYGSKDFLFSDKEIEKLTQVEEILKSLAVDWRNQHFQMKEEEQHEKWQKSIDDANKKAGNLPF